MKKNKTNVSQARTAYGMIAPSMLIIVGLGFFPVLFTLWFSLNDVNPGSLEFLKDNIILFTYVGCRADCLGNISKYVIKPEF